MGLDLEVVIIRPDHDNQGDGMRISMDSSDSVLDLKHVIEEMDEALEVSRQRLIWGGRQLADAEILQNVFRRVTDEEESPKVQLTMRRYAYATTPVSPPRRHRPEERVSIPVPTQLTEPPRPTQLPEPPQVPQKSARDEMNAYLMNKAYWSAAAEYGAIMTHAAQLGYDVPFGDSMFNPAPQQPSPMPEQPAHRADPRENPPQMPAQFDNPEDAEIAQQIAAAEAQQAQPMVERHIKLAIKLAFFVVMLSQDASSERMLVLTGIAVAIFLVQTGALTYVFETIGLTSALQALRRAAVGDEPVRARGGILFEIQLFVVSLFACLMPGVHPPEVVWDTPAAPEGAAPEEQRGADPEHSEMAESDRIGVQEDELGWDKNDVEHTWEEMDHNSLGGRPQGVLDEDSTRAVSEYSGTDESEEADEELTD